MNDRERDGDSHRDPSGSETRTEPPDDHGDRSPPAEDSIPTEAPTGTAPDPDRAPTGDRGPDRDPETIRNWTGLIAALAVVSLLTAVAIVAIHDTTTPAIGAAALAAGFAAIGGISRVTGSDLVGPLADGWAEHRRYVGFAAGLFAFGGLVGAALFAAGVDLTELFLELIMEELGEGELDEGGFTGGVELSASFFIFQNTPPFLVSIAGAVTLGLLTTLIMVVNGVLIGNIMFAVGSETGVGVIIALIAPHGIFELPALFIAAGVGFRLVYRAGQRLAGSREALFTREYMLRTAVLVVFGWLVLVLAAFVEAYLTIPIAELFFPEQAG